MANKSMNARINVEFNEASSMEELRSGESVNTLFGKIKKWLNGLKSNVEEAAYLGDNTGTADIPEDVILTRGDIVNNLESTATNRPLSANQGKVLNERMSNAIASVTTDTEVTDIRVGADGKTYPTAGDAVRGQIGKLDESIVEISNIDNLTFVHGLIYNGIEVPDTNRCKSIEYVRVYKGSTIKCTMGKLYIAIYDLNKRWKSQVGWLEKHTFSDDCYIRILRAKSGDPTLTTDDIEELKNSTSISLYPIEFSNFVNDSFDEIKKSIFSLASRNFEHGIWYNGNIATNDTNRIRCRDYFFVPKNTKITVTLPQAGVFLQIFDINKGFLKQVGWFNEYTTENDCFVAITLRKAGNNPTIDESEFNLLASSTFFNYSMNDAISSVFDNIPRNDELPKYWTDELATILPKVNANMESSALNGDTFAFITDYHIEMNSGMSHRVLKAIKENVGLNTVVFGGDCFNGNANKNTVLGYLREFRKRFSEFDLYGIRGNHEYNLNDGGSESVRISDSEMYCHLIKGIEPFVITNGTYYYKDNANQKIRYIFLDARYENATNPIDDVQIAWMESRIRELDSTWSVVVFSHQLFKSNPSSGSQVEANPGYNASGTKIIDSLIGLKNNINATIIGIICGHGHYDYSTDEHGFLEIAVTCDTRNEYGGLPQTLGTKNEIAFDIFSINTSNKTVKTVRVGRGNDRNWYY